MPSAPQPDVSGSGEVVEVFSGDTLEEAMAYAVASLGPDLVVRRARKVRKGVQGLVGKDRYEVLAAPGAQPVPRGDAVGSAFDALLEQAEAQEQPVPVRRTTRPAPVEPDVQPVRRSVVTRAPRPVEAAPPQAVEVVAVPARVPQAAPATGSARRAVAAAPPPAPKPAAKPAAKTKAAPRAKAAAAPRVKAAAPARAATAVPKPAAKPAGRKASSRSAPSGWSRTGLAALGLPAAVLDALPADDPTDDLSWAAALAGAIATVLPPPAALSEQHPLVVDGYGLPGVLGLFDAVRRGFTPGTITSGDRRAPATASELALVVRAALLPSRAG